MYGSIHYLDYLDFVSRRDVDWSAYKAGFMEAYGEHPPIQAVLQSFSRGEPTAVEEFRKLFVFGDEDAGSFSRFQAKYDLLIAGSEFSKMGRRDTNLPAVIDELCAFLRKILTRQRDQNIGYAEQRMLLNPSCTRPQARELLEAILATCSTFEESDIQPRFAVSLPRDNPWPDWEVAREAALGPYGKWLTGIDFCFVEEGHPPKDKRELFDEVRSFNQSHPERALSILYHVGESFTDKSLASAVRWVHEAAELGAHRLGHAIALGVDPATYGRHTRSESVSERIDQLRYDLLNREGLQEFGVHVDVNSAELELRRLQAEDEDHLLEFEYDEHRATEVRGRQKYAIKCIKALGSVVEVCPTSNRRIGGISDPQHHPLVQFAANDVPFVVGTDDPGIFDTTLTDEIWSAIQIAGLPEDAFDEIANRSWSSRSEVLSGREDS